MKIGKRIYSLLFILFTALALVTACKNPYKGMKLSIEGGNLLVQEYSEEEGANFFDIKAIVSGVDSKKVNTSVSFTGYNPKIIKPATNNPQVSGGTTTQKFAILDTGRTTIKVSTIEGSNSGVLTETIDVNITRGVDGFEFTYTTLPIIRGVATDVTTNVYDGSGYITYTPNYTTERGVTLKALNMYDEELTEGVEINGSTVTVTDSALTQFKLQATSVNNDELDPIVTEVEVLDAINKDDFSVKQLVDGTLKELNKEIVGNELMYNINLSNADSDANDENAKTMDVFMGEDSINDYDSKYVLRARNLNASSTGINGLEYSAVRRNDDGSYTVSEGRGAGSDQIVLLVYYKGYENIFAPIEIPVNVAVNTYPTTINFVRNTTDTTTMDNIILYKNSNYVNTVGTSVYLQVRNSRGNLIGQQAYVYAVNKASGEVVNNGIMIYRFVGGNLERVYATTPVKHGEQLFINYVYNAEFVNHQYMLVAKSVFFEDVYSYSNPANVGKNNLQLIQSDINVSVPSLTISKGTEVALTNAQVFGTPNPAIRMTDLTITSADTSMIKVRYDYDGDAVYLSAIEASKMGSVAITIKAPNGVEATSNVVVYTPTSNDNTSFVFGGRSYIGDVVAINEIDVISNSRLDGVLVIDGVEYTKIPDGVTFIASDFDTSVVTMGSDASEVHVFVLDVTKSTTITFTLTNLNDATTLTYKFLINVIQPITELSINTALVPSLYSRNSISMTGYDSYKNHMIVTTPQPTTTTLDGEFSFNVRYNGSFYDIDTVNGNLYTFKIIPDVFMVYITALTDADGELTGEFNVQTYVSDTNTYSFYVYVAYSQTYTNVNEEFTVRKTNNVLITTKSAVKVESIITDLTNNKIEFNTNDLVGTDGNYTSGNAQAFDFRITPNERNIFESKIILLNGVGNTLTLTETTPGVYNNDYFTITVDNQNNSVDVKLKQLPIDDSYKVQKFVLAALDSQNGSNYTKTYAFEIKINDGTSEDFAFVVTSAEQLLKVNNQLDAYYRLGADIYLDSYNRDGAWKSIGTSLTPFKGWFSGEYNGHYYSIYNLRITEEDKLDNSAKLQDSSFGLFAVNQGIITDLKIVNAFVRVVYVQTEDDDIKDVYVGAFAGVNKGIITNCSVETNIGRATTDGQYIDSVGKVETPLSGIIVRDRSNIAHNSFVGGVAGINAGQITNTTAKVELLANDNMGGGIVFAGGVAGANTTIAGPFNGIIAAMQSGLIQYDSATELYSNNYDVDMTFNPYTAGGVYDLINTNSMVGGIVGFNNPQAFIEGAYVRSYIRGYNNVGGLVGINYSAVENCTVQTTIIANDNVGGAVGTNVATSSNTHNILNNSFQYTTTGVVTLQGYIDGVKVQFVSMLDAYSYFNTSIYAHNNVGGLIGYNYGLASIHTYNSAYTYSSNTVTVGYSTTNKNRLYYGDIVATGSSVGGMVGYAEYLDIKYSLANVNIQALDNTSYVGGAVGTAVAGVIVTSSQVAGNVIGTNNVGGFFGDASQISDTYASMAGITNEDIMPTSSGALFSYKKANTYTAGQYHIVSSYTLLKSNGNYVTNFAFAGETKKGTQDVNVARLYYSGGAYLIDYLDMTGKLVGQISGVEEEKLVTATVNVERNLVLAANSFYIGFETINSVKDAITFTEDNTKVLTYLVGTDTMSSYNYGTSTYYDNLRNFPATLVNDVAYTSYGLTTAGNAFNAGNQIVTFEVNEITSIKGSTATNYTIYQADASSPTGYTEGHENTDMVGKDYYYNASVFGGYPVAFANPRVAGGKVNLVFDIAPTDINLTATENFKYGSDNQIVALAITKDANGNTVSYQLTEVINCGVVPAFADDSKFVITSLDSTILDYDNGVLTGVNPGVTRLRFVSVFDHNVVKEITVVVYFENSIWNLLDKNNTPIANGSTLYVTQGYATTINTTLDGVGVNPATGVTITSANTDADLAKLTINGVTLTQNADVNFTETSLVVLGSEEVSVTLTIAPYIEIEQGGTTYRIYTGESRDITIIVVRGNYSITVKGDVTINPITTLQFDVTVKTDNPSLSIQNSYDANYLPTIASQDAAIYKVYKGSELLTPVDNLFDSVLLITPQGTNNGTFTFEISVDPRAYELADTRVYTFVVYAMRYDGVVISKQFNITVIPQQLSSVILTNYSRLFYEDGTNAEPDASDMQLYKMPSDSIVPGYAGLLQIDLNPSYGKFDFITVTSSRAGIDFEQMLESQNLGEFSKMTFWNHNTSPINNGIKITDKLSTYFGEVEAYDGRIFVRVNAISGLSGGTVTLTVRCHVDDGKDTVVYTSVINLVVIDAPRIALTVDDGNKYGVIATGMSKLINVKTYGSPDHITIDTNGIDFNWVDGNIQLQLNAGRTKAELLDEAGKEIVISANVRKTINNIVYDFTDTLTLRVVKYVINSIDVDHVKYGKFVGKYNQIYSLRVIIDASYNKKLDDPDYENLVAKEGTENSIIKELAQLKASIESYGLTDYVVKEGTKNYTLFAKTGTTNTWYLVNGASVDALQVKTYNNFQVRNVYNSNNTVDNTSDDWIETLSIQNTNVYATETLTAKVSFTYTNTGSAVISTNTATKEAIMSYAFSDVDESYHAEKFKNNTYAFESRFSFDFSRLISEETPDPINNVEQFKDMQPKGHYILQTDLVLENWVPIEANFASLDGNSHVITIKSFAPVNEITEATSDINLGLFSKVGGSYDDDDTSKTTTIKNLNIEIIDNITIDISGYTNVKFGIIAGSNEGVITNCRVVNDAASIIQDRLDMLSIMAGSLSEAQAMLDTYEFHNGAVLDNNARKLAILGGGNGSQVEALPKVPTIYLQGNQNQPVGNRIAGLIGTNMSTGYITNCGVDNLSIQGCDYVAGFVAVNDGNISSSYFRGGNVISTDSNSKRDSATSAFVVENGGNAQIQYSYAQGRFDEDITGLDETTKLNFAGYKALVDYKANLTILSTAEEGTDEYKDALDIVNKLANFVNLRALNSVVYTNNYATGFVFNNKGYINNSYSNIMVQGTASAGFAYTNNGDNSYIEGCYSMSSGHGSSFSVFTNKVSATIASDKIKDCFYLVVGKQDINDTIYQDKFSNLDHTEGIELGAISFRDYNSFQNYAFNSDYSANSVDEVTTGVWFIPLSEHASTIKSLNNIYSDYFRHSGYSYDRPELVSANIRVTPLKVYKECTNIVNGEDKGFDYEEAKERKSHATTGIDGKTAEEIADNKLYVAPTENKVNMEYGKTIINPYLTDTAFKFNDYCTKLNYDSDGDSEEDASGSYIRLIKDIKFDNINQVAQTYNKPFMGDLDGNGLNIENLRILSETVGNAESFGLFGKIEDGHVRNLNIQIEEIWGVNVPSVGVLAGIIRNSTISNIAVSGENIVVQGLNAVGGVAGIVEGDSFLVNISSNVSVKANYRGNVNLFSANNSVNTSVTTFNLYAGSSEDDKLGINTISYAGGVVGILNVTENPDFGTTKLKKFGRARRNFVEAGVVIDAQVVGGLYGYVGHKTTVSDSYVVVDANTKLNATRVAGGLAGVNLGTIQRSYVAHAGLVQEGIDNLIAKNYSTYDNVTRDNEITNVAYNMYGKNPHYMGGLVGMNLTGNIRDSYNKVPVNNINAEFAGGIVGLSVGGELDSVYTTATVNAFRGIGGIIGIQTYITEDNTKVRQIATNDDSNFKNNYIGKINNELHYGFEDTEIFKLDQKLEQSAYVTTIINVVGANVWLYSHTNVNRSVRFQRDAVDAHIGTLAGLTTHDYKVADNTISNGGFVIDKAEEDLAKVFVLRMSNDKNFFKLQYSYNTINNSVKEVVNEIGYISGDYYSNQSNILKKYVDNKGTATVAEFTKSTDKSKTRMLSGVQTIAGTQYIFSRMQVYGSLRTLEEIINRISTRRIGDQAVATMGLTNNLSFTELNVSSISGTIVDHRIYYDWSQVEWDGTACETDGTKINSQYIFPGLSSKVEPSQVLVYNEADLKLMHDYLDAEFILQDNITLVMPWNPVGSKTEPFTGTVRSSSINQGTYNDYAIRNFNVSKQYASNLGLVAYSKLAHFHNFSMEPVVVESKLIADATNTNINLAVLVAEADETTINNINIRGTEGTSELRANGVTAVGPIVAKGIGGTTIVDCTVSDLEINIIDDHDVAGSIYAGGAFGALGGVTSWVEDIAVTNVHLLIGQFIDPINPIDPIDPINPYCANEAIAIGGVGGYLEIQPHENPKTNLVDTTVTGNSFSGEISIYTNVDSGFKAIDMGVGSIFGIIEGDDEKGAYVTFEGASGTTPINISHADTNIGTRYLPIGGLFGSVANANITNSNYHANITVKSCSATNAAGNVNGFVSVGGIVGQINGVELTNAVVTTNIMHTAPTSSSIIYEEHIGGAVGNATQSFIDYVYVIDSHIGTNALFNTANIGGVMGKASNSHVNHLVTNKVMINASQAESSYIGGLVGHMLGKNGYEGPTVNDVVKPVGLYNSVSNVDITTNMNTYVGDNSSCIGGLIGCLNVNSTSVATINGCYSTGNLSTTDESSQVSYLGGLIGRINQESRSTTNLTNSYSLVNILINNEYTASNKNNVIGYVDGGKMSVSNVYSAYDINPNLGYSFNYTDTNGNSQSYDSRVTTADLLNNGVTFDAGIFTQNLGSTMPLLSWIEDATSDTSSANYVYEADIAKLSQDSGTKQKPSTDMSDDQHLGYIMRDVPLNMSTLNGYVYVQPATETSLLEITPVADDEPIFDSIAFAAVVIGTYDYYNENGDVNIFDYISNYMFVRTNNGKIVKINLNISQEYIVNQNHGLIYGCYWESQDSDDGIVGINKGIIDTCHLKVDMSYILSVEDFGYIYNSKIIKKSNTTIYDEGEYEYNTYYELFDVTDVSAIKYVYRYGNSSNKLSLTTEQANNIDYYSPMSGLIDFSKFLMISGDDYPADNILRLRWEFKDKFWDDDIKDTYYWERCTDWDTSGDCQEFANDVATLIYNGGTIMLTKEEDEKPTLAQKLAIFATKYNELQPTNSVTVKINSSDSIDLSGRIWTPIRNFIGNINGFGVTISNMSVYTINYSSDLSASAGFIANTKGDTQLENIKFEYANVLNVNAYSVYSAVVVGYVGGTLTLDKIAVSLCSVLSAKALGSNVETHSAGFVGILPVGHRTNILSSKSLVITDSYAILVVGYNGQTGYNYYSHLAYRGLRFNILRIERTYSIFLSSRVGTSIPAIDDDKLTITIKDGIKKIFMDRTNYLIPTTSATFTDNYNHVDSTTYTMDGGKTWQGTTKLQTSELAGFDWIDTWMRNDAYWGLPQLTSQVQTWQDYSVLNNKGTGYNKSMNGSILTLTVGTPEELGRVAYQLASNTWLGELSSTVSGKTITGIDVIINTNIDLGKEAEDGKGKRWRPIEFDARFNNCDITFQGANSNITISRMDARNKGDSGFITNTSAGDGQLKSLTIKQLKFGRANVVSGNESGANDGYAAVVVGNGTNVTLQSVAVTNCEVTALLYADSVGSDKSLSAGLLAGMLTNSTITDCSVIESKLAANNVMYSGGLVGFCDDCKMSQNKVDILNLTHENENYYGLTSAGGFVGYVYNCDDSTWSQLEMGRDQNYVNEYSNGELNSITTLEVSNIGGAFGCVVDNDETKLSTFKQIRTANITLNSIGNTGGIILAGGLAGYVYQNTTFQDCRVGDVEAYSSGKTYYYKPTSEVNTIAIKGSAQGNAAGGAFGQVESASFYEIFVDATVSNKNEGGSGSGYAGGIFGVISSGNTIINIYWMNRPNYQIETSSDRNTVTGAEETWGYYYGENNAYSSLQSYTCSTDLAAKYTSKADLPSAYHKFVQGSAWEFATASDGKIVQILPKFVLSDYSYDDYYTAMDSPVINSNTVKVTVDTDNKWNATNAFVRYRYDVKPVTNIEISSDFELSEMYPMGTTQYPFNGSVKSSNSYSREITIKDTSTDLSDLRSDIGFIGYAKKIDIRDVDLIYESNADIGVCDANYINVGGLIGRMDDGSVNDCTVYSSTHIRGGDNVGGLVGNLKGGYINNSHTFAEDESAHVNGLEDAGGIVGQASGDISECYSDIYVNGDYCVGGIVGGSSGSYTISNCTYDGWINYTSLGQIDKQKYIGGIIGNSLGLTLDNNEFKGYIMVGDYTVVGGIAGNVNGGTIKNNSVTSSATMDKIYLQSYSTGSSDEVYYYPSSTSSVADKKYVGGLVGYWPAKPTFTGNSFAGTMNLDWYFLGAGAGTGLPSTSSAISSWWGSPLTIKNNGTGAIWSKNTVTLSSPYKRTLGQDYDYYDLPDAGITFMAGVSDAIYPKNEGTVYTSDAKIVNHKDISTVIESTGVDDDPFIYGEAVWWRAQVDYHEITVTQYSGMQYSYGSYETGWYTGPGFTWTAVQKRSTAIYYIANCEYEAMGWDNVINRWNETYAGLTLNWNTTIIYNTTTTWTDQTKWSFGWDETNSERPTNTQSYE